MVDRSIPLVLPSADYLRSCFAYDPETGLLIWKPRPKEHFSVHGYTMFNSRCAGKQAGWKTPLGYRQVSLDNTVYLVHRIIWASYHGEWPVNSIDHINGRKDDNRIVNLRDVTDAVNHRNQIRRTNNSSGSTGIVWHKRNKKWQAQLTTGGRNHYLGSYDDINDAIAARQRANQEMGFSPFHGKEDPNEPFQPILKPSTSQ